MKTSLTECTKSGSYDGRPGWVIGFNYDADVVESLKNQIPHTEREWREKEKRWWVSEEYMDELKLLFANFEALALWQGKLF